MTFADDGTTRTFELDECFTSDTDPGRFASGVAPEGAMSVHGTDSEGWELDARRPGTATRTVEEIA